MMRMDDNYVLPASPPIEPSDKQPARATTSRGARRLRFTSNVVGSLFLLTDMSASSSVYRLPCAYAFVRGSHLVAPVHITAFILMLGSFLLIRSRGTLIDAACSTCVTPAIRPSTR